MKEIEILRELFDKKILGVLSTLASNQHTDLSLSEVAVQSRVHPATTLRILDKLSRKDYLQISAVGKTKVYRLKQGERGNAVTALLKKDQHITEFIQKVSETTRVKKIIVEDRSESEVKVLLVGEFPSTEKINAIVADIKRRYGVQFSFLELSEKQYNEMENLGIFNLSKKIAWERR